MKNSTASTSPEQSYLAGKAIRLKLPVLPPGAESRDVALKRLLLPQGELSQLFTGGEGNDQIQYLAVVELIAGQPRGNHYHKRKRETFYVITGEVVVRLRDRASSAEVELTLQSGELLRISPDVDHVLLPTQGGYGLEFALEPFDPADTFKAQLNAEISARMPAKAMPS